MFLHCAQYFLAKGRMKGKGKRAKCKGQRAKGKGEVNFRAVRLGNYHFYQKL
jgi:hypothetical protein